jgi:uncharacterized protein
MHLSAFPIDSGAHQFFAERMLVEIRASPIHGQGAFALADIPAGTPVLEYVGERISKEESLRRCEQNNTFIFYLSPEYDLDGDVNANPAKWLNHSCAPNCEVELIDERLWVIAKRSIPAGEELTFDYGYDLESLREHPCHCGAPQCVGFIVAEEFHPQLRRAQP